MQPFCWVGLLQSQGVNEGFSFVTTSCRDLMRGLLFWYQGVQYAQSKHIQVCLILRFSLLSPIQNVFIPDVELLKQQQAPWSDSWIRFIAETCQPWIPALFVHLKIPQAFFPTKADLFCRPEGLCCNVLSSQKKSAWRLGGVFSDCIMHGYYLWRSSGPPALCSTSLAMPGWWGDHADPQWHSSIFLAFRWGRYSHHEFCTAEVVGPSGPAALSSVLSKCGALLRHLRVSWMGFKINRLVVVSEMVHPPFGKSS